MQGHHQTGTGHTSNPSLFLQSYAAAGSPASAPTFEELAGRCLIHGNYMLLQSFKQIHISQFHSQLWVQPIGFTYSHTAHLSTLSMQSYVATEESGRGH